MDCRVKPGNDGGVAERVARKMSGVGRSSQPSSARPRESGDPAWLFSLALDSRLRGNERTMLSVGSALARLNPPYGF